MKKQKNKSSSMKPACGFCGAIGMTARSLKKTGWPENDTYMPEGSGSLVTIRVIWDHGNRKKLIQQCPACSAYFLYELDYEFLANGSEDEEKLTRISASEAMSID